jgi:hypothetical protein
MKVRFAIAVVCAVVAAVAALASVYYGQWLGAAAFGLVFVACIVWAFIVACRMLPTPQPYRRR